MKRIVKYKNSAGMELVFNNDNTLYCENIDTDSTPGRLITEQPAFMPGQITLDRSVGAKLITADFAFCDRYGDNAVMDTLCEIFSPMYSGTISIYDSYGKEYAIDVTPAASVTPKRQEVSWVYKMSVEFIADFPFWREGKMQNISMSYYSQKTITNYGYVSSPLQVHILPKPEGVSRCELWISIYEGSSIVSSKRRGTLRIYSGWEPTKDLYINCQTLAVTDGDGNDMSYMLNVTQDLSELYLVPGKNLIISRRTSDGTADFEVGYYLYRSGVPKWS